jgi:signal transduction histidine kinase/ActR/RegA family two-component response regulator
MASGLAAAPFSSLSRLNQIMDVRRRQVGFRLAMMGLMVVFFSRYVSFAVMVEWTVVYSALQAWEFFGLPRGIFGRPASALRSSLSLATIALNSIVFGLPAILWTTYGGALGLACGAYLLSGSVLNTVFTTRDCRAAFIASLTPFMIYVTGGAFLASGRHLQIGTLITVAIAGAMMSTSAIILWIAASRTQRSEAAALEALSAREAELERALRYAEDASQAKSAFLANMSHELRTPLNGVMGMASVLSRTGLTPSQAQMVEVVHSSAQSLQTLLSDILDLAKIEAAQIDLHLEDAAPKKIAANVAALFGAAAAEKGLSFTFDADEASEQAVHTDAGRLAQILTNLCSNALKFTASGSVTLSVRATPVGALRRVSFTVSDTGIGLSAAAKLTIFDRFAQADSSITRRFGGTGLGLSICRQLTELLGGRIDVESVEGEGAAFTVSFDLPAADAQAPAPQGAAQVPSPADSQGKRPRVLLVEDHPVNRQVVQLILADLADVDTAENGAEGVEAAHNVAYDVILMDMQMPVMDGVTATRTIRACESAEGRGHTPILMLTANALPEHVDMSIDAGADAHLSKPITAEGLLSAIDTALDAAAGEHAAHAAAA